MKAAARAAAWIAACMACIAAACGAAQTGPVAANAQSPPAFDNDRLPPLPAAMPAEKRLVRYRPDIAVVGHGAFADGLVAGRAHADLPEGWRAEVRVAPGCASEDCLHWIAWSGDGTIRVERLPRGDAGERRERATRRLDAIRVESFAGSRDAATRDPRTSYMDCGPEAGDAIALRDFPQEVDGRQGRIHLLVEVPGDPDATGAASACPFAAEPEADNHDPVAEMRQVAQSFHVLPEGWDASRLVCEQRIRMLCMQQSLQSQRDCANAACVVQAGFWEIRIDDAGDGRPRLRSR